MLNFDHYRDTRAAILDPCIQGIFLPKCIFVFVFPEIKKNLMFTYHDQFFLVPAFREISKNHERQFGVLIFSVKSQSRPTKSRTLLSFMKIFRETKSWVQNLIFQVSFVILSWNWRLQSIVCKYIWHYALEKFKMWS